MMASRWKLFLEWGSILSLIACAYWIFMLTPIETSQGFSQKIMYLHVPTVIVTYLAFFIVFAFSIAYLWKRDLMFDRIAKSSAEIGLLFCALVLISGAVWGRPTWGTYWVWDARLTTTLLLFLIFMGYFLLRMSTEDMSPLPAKMRSVLVKDYTFHTRRRVDLENWLRSIVKRDKDGHIVDDGHRTLPFMTRYELTRVLGMRAQQLDHLADPGIHRVGGQLRTGIALGHANGDRRHVRRAGDLAAGRDGERGFRLDGIGMGGRDRGLARHGRSGGRRLREAGAACDERTGCGQRKDRAGGDDLFHICCFLSSGDLQSRFNCAIAART